MDYQGEKKNWALEDKMRRQREAYLAAVRSEYYNGGTIPQHELEDVLRVAGLWTNNGRRE